MVSLQFSSDDIFEIAGQIERNGAAFYRQASKRFSDASVSDKLLGLAAMEEEHEKTFATLRDELSVGDRPALTFDPDNEAALFLQSVADGAVFDLKADPSEFVSEGVTIEEILKKAVGLEKDSIVFYAGMMEMVSTNMGKGKINGIIKEEIGHILILSKQLATLYT